MAEAKRSTGEKSTSNISIIAFAAGGIGLLKAYSMFFRLKELERAWNVSSTKVFLYPIALVVAALSLFFMGYREKKGDKSIRTPFAVTALAYFVIWLIPPFLAGKINSADLGFAILLLGLAVAQFLKC